MRSLFLFALCLAATSCVEPMDPRDGGAGGGTAAGGGGGAATGGGGGGGELDSGVPDAGLVDAGVPDSGAPDSGTPDAGQPDAGEVDSGVPDSGIDAGVPDAGPPDGDNDGFADALDNCPSIANPTQADRNMNGVGDACDPLTCQTPVDAGCTATEQCGNGSDDDCNGQVDELCPCTPGDVQRCFAGPPGRRSIGTCIDGMQICSTSTETWGPCTAGLPPDTEWCDGQDNDCNGCADDELASCAVSPLACPAPGSLPTGTPFAPYSINAASFFTGAVQAWRWEVAGGPCDQLFATTTSPLQQSFTTSGQFTSTFTFTPSLSGEYKVRLRIMDMSSALHDCNFVVRIAAPGLRLELCSDRTASTDLDLHLHRPGTTTDWFHANDDCHYANCKAATNMPANWALPASPLSMCVGGPEGTQWQNLGFCRNPRLELDSINQNGVPEEIAVDLPYDNQTFRPMVHYYGGTGVTHPMVNVYCGGVLRAVYGDPGNQVTNFDTPGGTTGDLWRVADITLQVDGGVTTGCTSTPLHPPGMTTGYFISNNRNY